MSRKSVIANGVSVCPTVANPPATGRVGSTVAALSAGLLLSACAGSTDLAGITEPLSSDTALAPASTGSIKTGALTSPATGSRAGTPSQADVAEAPRRNTRTSKTGKSNVLAEVSRLRALNRRPQALALLDETAAAGKGTPESRLTHGLLALELGKLSKARKLLEHANETDPPNWRILSGLGSVYAAEGNQAKAQKAFAQALRLKPDHPSILNNLALSYALDGKQQRAEAVLRRAVADGTADPQAKQNLALLLGLEGRKTEAVSIAETVMPKPAAEANLGYLEKLRSSVKVSKDERPNKKVRAAQR